MTWRGRVDLDAPNGRTLLIAYGNWDEPLNWGPVRSLNEKGASRRRTDAEGDRPAVKPFSPKETISLDEMRRGRDEALSRRVLPFVEPGPAPGDSSPTLVDGERGSFAASGERGREDEGGVRDAVTPRPAPTRRDSSGEILDRILPSARMRRRGLLPKRGQARQDGLKGDAPSAIRGIDAPTVGDPVLRTWLR